MNVWTASSTHTARRVKTGPTIFSNSPPVLPLIACHIFCYFHMIALLLVDHDYGFQILLIMYKARK
jgi:hypothetical protein